ncbi:MAG: hypothetical protein K2X55_02595 [Burkholderiaceae bacterium]|nr:hypothetical protein [Burkholderiaceae bacterium]
MCGKDFPRKVNFCPFCGTRQGGAQARPDERVQAEERARADERTRAAERAKADAQAKLDEQARVAAKRQADEQARADAARAEALAQVRDGAAVAGSAAQQPSDALTSDQQAALERLNQLRGNGKPAAAAAASAKSTASASAHHSANAQGNGAAPSPPPLRKPISKSTWVLVAILLGLIWFLARPSDPAKKLQARVDQAVAQAQDCKIDLARNEYTSLKADKASAAQLKQVQDTISANAKKCDAKRNRAKAWNDLRPQLESALQSGSIDQADRRLAAFTKTWGADDETRELDGRIDVRKGERLLNDVDACIKRADRACAENKLQAAEKLQRNELKPRIEVLREALSQLLLRTVLDQSAASQPVSAPPPATAPRAQPGQAAKPLPATPSGQQAQPAPQAQPSQQAQQARKLLSEAERELRQGNYKAAMDKANICATMIDEGNRECTALKNRAERMNRELMNCVASGREWIDDRCQ